MTLIKFEFIDASKQVTAALVGNIAIHHVVFLVTLNINSRRQLLLWFFFELICKSNFVSHFVFAVFSHEAVTFVDRAAFSVHSYTIAMVHATGAGFHA